MSFNSQNIVYMNGPTPVAEPTAIINPKNNNMNTSGIIHINLRFQKKVKTSPAILNLLKISFNIRIFPNYISIETPQPENHFSLDMMLLPITSVSIPVLIKVSIAFSGVVTIGSPLMLNEVFSNIGIPVTWPNSLIRL